VSQLGLLLRETRLKQKISLDELQEVTKIRKGYLEAIEEGNYRLLPGSFYVKAFIRAYAEAVGIDPSEALKLYGMEASPEHVQELLVEPTIRGRRGNTRNMERWSRMASTLLVVVFVVLILGIIYYFYYNNTSRNPNNTSDSQRVTDTTPVPSATAAPSASPSSTPTATPTPSPTPVPQNVKSLGTQNAYDIYEISAPKLSITVKITGKESWMSVQSVDAAGLKTMLYTGSMKTGETQTWDTADSVQLRLGAASNVELTVNGSVIPVGDLPNVKNFKFNLVKP
jgi:cytoskeletal protein RodZ